MVRVILKTSVDSVIQIVKNVMDQIVFNATNVHKGNFYGYLILRIELVNKNAQKHILVILLTVNANYVKKDHLHIVLLVKEMHKIVQNVNQVNF